MRLLLIYTTFPYSNAAEEFFVSSVRELICRGHEITIVPRSPSGPVPKSERDLLERTISLPLLSARFVAAIFYEAVQNPFGLLRAVRVLLSRTRPSNMIKNIVVFPKAVWIGRYAREENIEHIHAYWATAIASMAMYASELTGIPWSFSAHRGDIVQNNALQTKLRLAKFARFISRSGIELAKKVAVHIDVKKTRLIHMGVAIPPDDGPDNICEVPTILCAANLVAVKGHIHLLKAVAILKSRGTRVRLMLAGHGELRDDLENAVREIEVADNVSFLGQIPHVDVLELYRLRKVQIFVLPSVDLGGGEHEGIPVSLMEAMAHGIPVVSTSTGGIPELLDDEAGIMVPQKDPTAIADAIENLIRDAALRKRVSANGRARVVKDFSAVHVVDELEKALRE